MTKSQRWVVKIWFFAKKFQLVKISSEVLLYDCKLDFPVTTFICFSENVLFEIWTIVFVLILIESFIEDRCIFSRHIWELKVSYINCSPKILRRSSWPCWPWWSGRTSALSSFCPSRREPSWRPMRTRMSSSPLRSSSRLDCLWLFALPNDHTV